MFYLVELHSLCNNVLSSCVALGAEHTQQFKYVQLLFVFIKQGKIDYSFGLKIYNRYRRVDHLTRRCRENEPDEVSALFQEKRINC